MAKIKRPTALVTATRDRAKECGYDGAEVDEHGYCWQGQGYPQARWWWNDHPDRKRWERVAPMCHLACPLCGYTLNWDGACWSCFGSRTPSERRTWTFQARFELRRGHWVQVEGPTPACSPERVKEAMALVKAVREGAMTAKDAHTRLDATRPA